MKFIVTKDEKAANKLIKKNLVFVSKSYDTWVFINDGKKHNIKNITYTNTIAV